MKADSHSLLIKRTKHAVVLAFWLSIVACPKVFATTDLDAVYSTLTNLEQATLGKTFATDLVTTRVERLENKLFGKKQTGSLKARIDGIAMIAPEQPIVTKSQLKVPTVKELPSLATPVKPKQEAPRPTRMRQTQPEFVPALPVPVESHRETQLAPVKVERSHVHSDYVERPMPKRLTPAVTNFATPTVTPSVTPEPVTKTVVHGERTTLASKDFFESYVKTIKANVRKAYAKQDADLKPIQYSHRNAKVRIDRDGTCSILSVADDETSGAQKVRIALENQKFPAIPIEYYAPIELGINFHRLLLNDGRRYGLDDTWIKQIDSFHYQIGQTIPDEIYRVNGQIIPMNEAYEKGSRIVKNSLFLIPPQGGGKFCPMSGLAQAVNTAPIVDNYWNIPFINMISAEAEWKKLSTADDYNDVDCEITKPWSDADNCIELSSIKSAWARRPKVAVRATQVAIDIQVEPGQNTSDTKVSYSSGNDVLDNYAKKCIVDNQPLFLRAPYSSTSGFTMVIFDTQTGAVRTGILKTEFTEYMKFVEKLKSNWHPDKSETHVTKVTFDVSLNGDISNIKVTEPVSEKARRDAIEIIKAVGKLPPLPLGVKDSVLIELTFPPANDDKKDRGKFRNF